MHTKAKFKYAFFDTSSLMHGNLEAFWSISAPALIEAGTQIIISNSCVKELEKHINSNFSTKSMGFHRHPQKTEHVFFVRRSR